MQWEGSKLGRFITSHNSLSSGLQNRIKSISWSSNPLVKKHWKILLPAWKQFYKEWLQVYADLSQCEHSHVLPRFQQSLSLYVKMCGIVSLHKHRFAYISISCLLFLVFTNCSWLSVPLEVNKTWNAFLQIWKSFGSMWSYYGKSLLLLAAICSFIVMGIVN